MDRRSASLALALGAALAACARGATASSSAHQVAHVGNPAPDWSEPSIPGPTLSFASLRGKAVYLNFFASWCPPCNEEAPSIDALAREYAARGVQIIGVDVLENARKAAQFRSEHTLSYPVVVDDGTVRDQYRVNGLPVHVFIDRTGIVRKIVVGELSPTMMRTDIETMLR
ncbi:MAG TPA: TlpA disulfide reductase family protein [Candidatus Cybelea sp.]|jgi:thiol-disulfide isomerase/thioredoxin|nr:TlpA disulfide reductase family protein [Candidatus Cybelea sp.]